MGAASRSTAARVAAQDRGVSKVTLASAREDRMMGLAAARPSPRRRPRMRLAIAIFLPFLVFFTIGRPIAGIVCLILQITLIGWIPAALWAVYALSQWKTDKRIEEAIGRKAG